MIRRVFALSAFIAPLAVTLAHGCKEPTQVTLDITLRKDVQCSKARVRTGISVGIEPLDTEKKVESGFLNAQTDRCDDATKSVGTLVVTPSEADRSSVVVVVGFGDKDPVDCKPPRYAGCVVARRRFAFAKSKPLTMPILIDPLCTDVPCDAFTTCRDGRCFDSLTDISTCGPDGCLEPGETADGSTDFDAAKEIDGSPPPLDAAADADALASDGASDGGSDATDADMDAANPAAHPPGCFDDPGVGRVRYCFGAGGGPNAVPCPGPSFCCNLRNGPTCQATPCPMPQGQHMCCTASDCSGEDIGMRSCSAPDVVPLMPKPGGFCGPP